MYITVSRAKCHVGVRWLPESIPRGRVASTGHVNVTAAAAAGAREVGDVDQVLVMADLAFGESARMASSGLGGADGTW